MSFLPINDEVRAAVAAVIERASAKPMPWASLKAGIMPDGPTLSLADRPADWHRSHKPEQIQIGSFRCAYSVEEQPAGFCRHLSVSVSRPGFLPQPEIMAMITSLFGFTGISRTWIEEFEPGHHAMNVIELISPKSEGHA